MGKASTPTMTVSKLPSAHVQFADEIIQKVYGPKLKTILEAANPPTNVSQLAKKFQETYGVGTSPSTIAEWLKVMGLAPTTRVDWGTEHKGVDPATSM